MACKLLMICEVCFSTGDPTARRSIEGNGQGQVFKFLFW